MSYFRPTINDIEPYEPGEQPPNDVAILKLNTNENPYPPSPRATALLNQIDAEWLRRYPDPHATDFRLCASKVLNVPPEWILVGNGSDDILRMLMQAVADTGRPIAYPIPTYSLYRTLAQIQAAPIVEISYDETYALPLKQLIAAQASLTIIASPNSPSGNRIPNNVLKEIASEVKGVLAIDEAYVDFSTENALELSQQFDNVIIIRTLSKSHSLAGIRLGFAVGAPTLLHGLSTVKDSYNIDAIAARVGAAAYEDIEYTRTVITKVRASRQSLTTELAHLG